MENGTEVHPSDVMPTYRRSELSKRVLEREPFWISLATGPDGKIHKFTGVRFTTYEAAEQAARAIVELSYAAYVQVHEDLAVVRAAK